jgi:5-amino-6-(5-phosphoribosylamino)uracil reductase
MSERPYIVLSCSMSMDGYLSGPTDDRLVLSNEDDLDRVDAVRAECDAILVGASTVRRDNPRLLVRSARRREERMVRGLPPSPIKVTVTNGAVLDPCAAFFRAGDVEKIVYCSSAALEDAVARLSGVATIVDGGEPVEIERMAKDLYARGVARLMVEGGGSVHTQFLTAGLADELHLVVNPERRARLAEVRPIGEVVLLRYALSGRCPAES